MPPLRALIVDDEPLIRLGVRRALEAMAGVEIAGERGDVGDAVEAIAALAPGSRGARRADAGRHRPRRGARSSARRACRR